MAKCFYLLHAKVVGRVRGVVVPCTFPHACFAQVPLFSTLTPPQRSQLCTVLKPLHIKAGTVIVQAGNAGNTFYVVEAGTCVVHNVNNQVGEPMLNFAVFAEYCSVHVCCSRHIFVLD